MIRTSVEEISTMGRNTQGVRVINLKDGDSIADVTRVVIDDEEEPISGDGAAQDADVAAEDATDEATSAASGESPGGNGQADGE